MKTIPDPPLNELELRYLNKGISHYGVLLFKGEIAREFILEAKLMGYKVLGIDGFYLLADKIQPNIEYSTDWSSEKKDVAFELATEFLAKYSDIKDEHGVSLYFEVVLGRA